MVTARALWAPERMGLARGGVLLMHGSTHAHTSASP